MNHPRYAFLATLVIGAVAAIYWFASYDAGGTTTLGALAIAMGVLFYFLLSGSRET